MDAYFIVMPLCSGASRCRGTFGVYLESDGTTNPYRLKLVTPSLPAAAVVDSLTRGGKIADLITIGGSLDYIVPDIDR